MRIRSAWVIPSALITGLALAFPLTAAQAVTKPTATVVARRVAATVTLPTGEHVRLIGAKGKERVLIDTAVRSGPGRALVTHQLRGHTYVLPTVAEPYINRFLDKNLFDVTGLSAALPKNGRLPVRISYRGTAPAAPGITITSKSGGTARGYLTRRSSAAFGRALTAQWKADAKAGFPKRTSLFTGLTKISADIPGSSTVTPTFPMYTLVIKTIGADGKPQPFGFLALINVDDGRKYGAFVSAENGEARVSVPKGTYSAAGDDTVFNEADETSTTRFTTINEYKVNGAGQTMTLDYRTATAEPAAIVPKPATLTSGVFAWFRTPAAAESGSLGTGYFLDPSSRLLLTPSAPAKVGKLETDFSWALSEPVTTPTYTYNVVAQAKQIPAKPVYRFTDAQLATVKAAYYGEGPARTAGFVRYPLFIGVGIFDRVARGIRRTEYVGATGGPATWGEQLLVNYDASDDPGFVSAPSRNYPAGSNNTATWMKGPLSAAIPLQSEDAVCFACRYGNTIAVGLAPFTDSSLTHIGYISGAEDGLPVARFRFYKNGKLVSDQDDFLGTVAAVPAGKATYKAVLDVDRRLQVPAQSTQTRTELTFSSTKNAGPKLPPSWFCDGSDCRILPIVQARLALPLGINGTLPAGKSTVTVTVAQIQKAAKSAVTSAGLEFRVAGFGWTTVKLTSIGGGKYRGVLDNTGLEGSQVDVRFSGADKAGSKYLQTVVRAYTVAGS